MKTPLGLELGTLFPNNPEILGLIFMLGVDQISLFPCICIFGGFFFLPVSQVSPFLQCKVSLSAPLTQFGV